MAQSQKRSAVYDAITNPTNVTVEVAQRGYPGAESHHRTRHHGRHRGGARGTRGEPVFTDRSIDHVVLERGEVANSWRQERWDSLRLLTPNWLTRLPGCRYDGADPDGVHGHGGGHRVHLALRDPPRAPVRPHTTVTSVRQVDNGYHVATDAGVFHCRAVMLATGVQSSERSRCSAGRAGVHREPDPFDYRHPDQLPDGGVLIVGASATGVQFADEIRRSGRRAVLSVGEHVRLPRTYRGRDVLWWMDAFGRLEPAL